MTRKERYNAIIEYFAAKQPEITTELNFGNAFQLVVATVLSAQCTDKRVNIVTAELFRRYPDAASMAEVDEEDVLECIRSVSYPNAKAAHIVALARMLMDEFDGDVPDNMEDLMRLPGVGRKTANVFLAVWHDKPNMPVDTHVYRVSHRLGLVSADADTPYKVERQLLKNIPEEMVNRAHHWLLLHGRYICTSRKAKCDECPFNAFCPKLTSDSKQKH